MTTLDDLTKGGTVLPITRWGEPVMHAKTRPVTEFDDELHTLCRNMFATMEAAQGVGLAATQVGIDLAVFVYDCVDADDKRHVGVVCNPEVTLPTGKDRVLESGDEGCLSLPGAFQPLSRPDLATCTGQDFNGEPIELTATEFELLRFLMRNPRRVLSKAQILDRVWSYDFGGQANVVELYISYPVSYTHLTLPTICSV